MNFKPSYFTLIHQEPIDNGFNLGDLKTTEFSNPMYETIKTTESTATGKDDSSAIYEVPDKQATNEKPEKSDKKFFSSLTSIIGRGGVRDPIRQGSLNPSSVDSGKDTQQLVEEDKSEC